MLAFPALAALALTLALVFHASAAASVVKINIDRPVSGVDVFNPCTGVDITESGDEHLVVQETLNDAGGEHIILHINLHLAGTDAQGNAYSATETDTDELNINGQVAEAEETVPLTLVEVSQGTAPNFLEHVTLHVTFNADGTITTEVIHASATCLG